MGPMINYTTCTVLALLLLAMAASAIGEDEDRKVYIIYMGEKPSGQILTESVHLNLLDQILDSSTSGESLVYSYTKSFNGFAAKLTGKEAKKIAGLEGIVSIFPSRNLTYHTTRSWNFLQFPQNVTTNQTTESDVIIGVIDSGIWPESESFGDDGMGPPPAKWRGICQDIKCNNKLIGARVYSTNKSDTPRDMVGHGSHTASTAAGRIVQGANHYGLAEGTARGAVPSARIAAYKVCTPGCTYENILAAFDDAIADGVDVLSVSLGSDDDIAEYFDDPIAIGSFHAMKKGILTSVSAGNNGPDRGTVSNSAPWTLVSAASSMDRRIVDKIVLGDGTSTVVGYSVNTFPTQNESYPLVYPNPRNFPPEECAYIPGNVVKGNIVICVGMVDYLTPEQLGAKGVVLVEEDGSLLDGAYSYSLPALMVNFSEGRRLMSYANETKNPVANIHKSEAVFDSKAPVVAVFSSRGPSLVTPNILKPDITAPGVDVLAAWSGNAPPSTDYNDKRRVKYNIQSGTSMSCPHVSGAAAYVKSFHLDWSPAMIMSALMTTATPLDPAKNKDAELSYGAGQINPLKALNPGLVYDATVADYTQMLCDQGYNASSIKLITGDNSTCWKDRKGDPKDLNYPSMSFRVGSSKPFQGTFKRTVTNVGDPASKYTATVSANDKLKVTVQPQTLSFTKLNEKQSFIVTVSGGSLAAASVASASVVWSDGIHDVRSVLVVHTK